MKKIIIAPKALTAALLLATTSFAGVKSIDVDQYQLSIENWSVPAATQSTTTEVGGYYRDANVGWDKETLLDFSLESIEHTILSATINVDLANSNFVVDQLLCGHRQSKGDWNPNTVNYNTFSRDSWQEGDPTCVTITPTSTTAEVPLHVSYLNSMVSGYTDNDGLMITSDMQYFSYKTDISNAQLVVYDYPQHAIALPVANSGEYFTTSHTTSAIDPLTNENYAAYRTVVSGGTNSPAIHGIRVKQYSNGSWSEVGDLSNNVNQPKKLRFTQDGSLYLLAGSEVLKYDGTNWTTIIPAADLVGHTVTDLIIGKDNSIWIKTLKGNAYHAINYIDGSYSNYGYLGLDWGGYKSFNQSGINGFDFDVDENGDVFFVIADTDGGNFSAASGLKAVKYDQTNMQLLGLVSTQAASLAQIAAAKGKVFVSQQTDMFRIHELQDSSFQPVFVNAGSSTVHPPLMEVDVDGTPHVAGRLLGLGGCERSHCNPTTVENNHLFRIVDGKFMNVGFFEADNGIFDLSVTGDHSTVGGYSSSDKTEVLSTNH